ncbi:ERF family protein [Tsuneonella amylolytica]|uniref:ERF family protein n=1 Tax=Tsuneonella amylolytica TaxID=2338327 RepID=UPI000EAA849F|nr:ERF family protein [Tsuneonella amylolytica]
MIGRVYQAISAVAGELAGDGIAKTRLNARDNYLYRSIDDVLGALAPLLARHRLCILPRVLERSAAERIDASGALVMHVALKVAFDLVSAEDGSAHTIEAYGEALDEGDKGTAKAMQSAYKYAVLQAFCVPALAGEDADARSHKLTPSLRAEPAEGWPAWCAMLRGEIAACASPGDLRSLQQARRGDLAALSREQPALYRDIGAAFAGRQAALTGSQHDAATSSAAGEPEARDTGPAQPPARPAQQRTPSSAHTAENGSAAIAAATINTARPKKANGAHA